MRPVASAITIGERLRALRSEAGLSLRQAGAKCDLSASFIRMVELDETGISVERLTRLAGVYGLEVAELMGGPAAATSSSPAPEQRTLRFGDEDDIARAGAALFAYRAADGTAVVDELARRSGTDVRAHFRSDAELLVRSYELVLVDGGASLLSLPEDATAWQRVEAFVGVMTPTGAAGGDPSMRLWLEIVLGAATTERLAASGTLLYDLVIETWADLIGAGQAAGEMRGDVDARDVAWQLCGLVDGLSLQIVANSRALSPERLQTLVLAAVHRLLDPV